jgi:hypothetical protein
MRHELSEDKFARHSLLIAGNRSPGVRAGSFGEDCIWKNSNRKLSPRPLILRELLVMTKSWQDGA